MRCAAKRKDGEPCRGQAEKGKAVCYAHSGAKVGRPSALTPQVHDRLVQAKKAGAPDWVAAQSAGISETTYYELLKRGEAEASGPHRVLYDALHKAMADACLHAYLGWRRDMGTPGNWRACAAFLDRVERGRFTDRRGPEGPSDRGPRPRRGLAAGPISRCSPSTHSPSLRRSTKGLPTTRRRGDRAPSHARRAARRAPAPLLGRLRRGRLADPRTRNGVRLELAHRRDLRAPRGHNPRGASPPHHQHPPAPHEVAGGQRVLAVLGVALTARDSLPLCLLRPDPLDPRLAQVPAADPAAGVRGPAPPALRAHAHRAHRLHGRRRALGGDARRGAVVADGRPGDQAAV